MFIPTRREAVKDIVRMQDEAGKFVPKPWTKAQLREMPYKAYGSSVTSIIKVYGFTRRKHEQCLIWIDSKKLQESSQLNFFDKL